MQFTVADRERIEAAVRVRTAYAVISIHDPEKPKPRVRRQAGLRGVLYLAFHDAEPSVQMRLPEHVVLMTRKQAEQIWAFAREYAAQVKTIVVQCEQGMSRSPAIAEALSETYGNGSATFLKNYQPNQYVYQLMRSHRPEVVEGSDP